MVANIRGYTPNYGLKLINFDTPRWHTLEYSNWELVDAIMASTGLPGLRGEWINSTAYVVGERVFDNLDGRIYGCLVSHTSAATGTFAQDRAAHPTYWRLETLDTPRYMGAWAPGVAYSVADIVVVGAYTYYICGTKHTSASTFPPDAPKWALIFDATAAVNSTNASATAAAGSASAASTSASNAATSATNAQASAVESAAQAAKLFGTSTSSVTIGVGGRTFVTQSSKYFNVGKFIMARADSDPVNQWMWGQVTSYSGTSLIINSITSGGSGTYAAWTIDVSGSRGAVGPQGIQGELGPPLVIKGTVPTASALPPSGNTIGDMYIAEDTQHLHIWDGAQWDDAGPLGTSTTTTADIPPSNPKDGDMWFETDTGIFWVYYVDVNSSQWVQAGGTAASINQNFVLKTGDTMTGQLTVGAPLHIEPAAGDIRLRLVRPNTGVEATISSRVGTLNRWVMNFGTSEPETGANAGSNFNLAHYNDAGGLLGAALAISRATGEMTLTGLKVKASSASAIAIGDDTTLATNGQCGIRHLAYSDGSLYIDYKTFTGGGINFRCGAGAQVGYATNFMRVEAATGRISLGQGPVPTIFADVRIGFSVGGVAISTRPSNDSSQWHHSFENAAGTYVGVISTTATATAYSTSSDASLKEDLKSFDAGSIIDNTQVYDFAWKSTKERSFGVIAQQAVEVYPLAVTHQEASIEKGAERDEWWGVDYSKYVPVLLQELKALRVRVAELEGRTIDKPSTTPRGRK